MGDKKEKSSNFKIIKWYLDFVGEDGEVMIFYAAEIFWRGLRVPYTNILIKFPGKPIFQKSRLNKVSLPEKNGSLLTWADSIFQLEGIWEQEGKPLNARLFNSEEGSLNWNCWQPSSNVTLKYKHQEYRGRGYAEELILTAPAWKIPMQQLRWGRSLSEDSYAVWVEIRGDETQNWLWYNGERMKHIKISDSEVLIKDAGVTLKLDQAEILEHEQKIHNVVKLLMRYLPGFNKIIPKNFLMAEGFKWFSIVEEHLEDGSVKTGSAIHEYLYFGE